LPATVRRTAAADNVLREENRNRGSKGVIELHGTLSEVACLACGAMEQRAALQERLLAQNPGWLRFAADIAPDGDADLPAEHVAGFRAPPCLRCDGPLKPRVVLFGENVARRSVARAAEASDGGSPSGSRPSSTSQSLLGSNSPAGTSSLGNRLNATQGMLRVRA